MKNLMKFIAYLLSTLFAYFFPHFSGGFEAQFATFASFAPLVIFLAAELNTRLQWEDTKAWISTGFLSIGLAYLGYWLKLGELAEGPAWHPVLYGIGAWGVAVLGFSISQVKAVLHFIFNYSWKK